MATLVEISNLAQSRPGPGAAPTVVAAWYERKATLLDRIASQTGDQRAWTLAQRARTHAQQLLTGSEAA